MVVEEDLVVIDGPSEGGCWGRHDLTLQTGALTHPGPPPPPQPRP